MELGIAVLVLVSAAIHPFWNALVKRDEHPDRAFLALLVLTALLAGTHGLIAGADLMSIVRAWPFPLISAGGLFLYSVTLVLTLRRGDLSIYYPIIRSSPLFIVFVGFFLLSERYSGVLLLGIALVLVGAFLLQYRRGARLLADPLTLGLAVLAMSGTGIYSIADWHGVQIVEPMVMLFWSTLSCLPFFAAFFWWLHGGRHGAAKRFPGNWKATPWRYLGAGALAYVSYFLLLTAYQLGGNVAAVTSVRQASIPISVFLGGLYLKEADMATRLLWSLVLAAGIVVIVLSR